MRSEVGRWSVSLGVTGFLAGFLGPIALVPDANQGPMLGIFLTGPGGFALGALIGAVLSWLKVRPESSRRWMIGTCVVGASTILFFCLPKPKRAATILDVEVRGCVPATDWSGRAINNWEKRLAVNSWAKPPADWREHFQQAAAGGSVVTVTTRRRRDILASQMPWSRGKRSVAEWESEPVKRIFRRPNDFYVSGTCSGFAPGARGVYLAKAAEGEESYPPRDPSRFLDMIVLDAVPDDLAAMAH